MASDVKCASCHEVFLHKSSKGLDAYRLGSLASPYTVKKLLYSGLTLDCRICGTCVKVLRKKTEVII